jgi:hypothetical protein
LDYHSTGVKNMRKIEKEMCLAIGQRKTWQNNNTSVRVIDDVNMGVFLHGNHIADVNTNTGFLMVNNATLNKWPTRTTKSRLRALGAKI